MMVTFVSQCEKKSLNRTRRVLDAFANRIGTNTWQTPITKQGLDAVKKLLRKTASKNTAVSCHQLKSRTRTELLWVVGNKEKFNKEGFVPVNYTRSNMLNNFQENDWQYLPLIKSLTVFAALFHDLGKSSRFFQDRLNKKITIKGSPLKHEWVSVLFLIAIVKNKTDEDWLSSLETNDLHNVFKKLDIINVENLLSNLPPLASMLAWLILSHHKMPKIGLYADKPIDLKGLLSVITKEWGYQTCNDTEYETYVKSCLSFKELPTKSLEWQIMLKEHATLLKKQIKPFTIVCNHNILRPIMLYSRLSLILADHFYSSKRTNKNWNSDTDLFANTKNGEKDQKLDEHLVGVAVQAAKNVQKLPFFDAKFNEKVRVYNKKQLKDKSPSDYSWQDHSVREIVNWRKTEKTLDKEQFGFFVINMASTGKGKTFANAKIMQALSPNKDSLRYILALGLRTLTLQTGTEYKKKIGLDDSEIAILIGSKAILNLHNQNYNTVNDAELSSESSQSLSDEEVIFTGSFDEQGLDTILENKKHRQLLHAPVLSCTIDHIIQATEVVRGGRFILPTLRLMSSDLVIDEVDDFDGEDLIAIGRLIHLAGMLGRKVVISSATIPPDLAEGYFNAYQSGWKIFATMQDKEQSIGCAWIDEFKTTVCSINKKDDYQTKHNRFIEERIKKLNQQPIKRRVNIIECTTDLADYFKTIQQEILCKHNHHHFVDNKSKKTISIGVIRIANITPCINLTKFLLGSSLNEIDIIPMAYHSKQVLLMRHEQEKYLDKILNRKNGNEHILNDPVIRAHISQSQKNNVTFVLVATPVEEVGRDHDFDWAIIEPSSYRSFIQLAGRVLRHRNIEVINPNIGILQYNYRALKTKGKEVAFKYPGYQELKDDLNTYDLKKLIDTVELAIKLDATQRIKKPKALDPKNNLADLEHEVIADLLTNYTQKGAQTMQGWLDDVWWLSGTHQFYIKFRKGSENAIEYLMPDSKTFAEQDRKGNRVDQNHIEFYELDENENNIWFKRNYKTLLKQYAKGSDLEKEAFIYGEITLETYGKALEENQFKYNEQLGLYRK